MEELKVTLARRMAGRTSSSGIHTGVYTDRRIVTSNTGMATFQELQLELIDYARKHYPKEFAEIKNPRP